MKSTKRAFVTSLVCLLVCLSMLIGSTFAWFTDSASTAVSTIKSGNLKVALVDENGVSLEGETLSFKDANGKTDILWEPGATFVTDQVYVKNEGDLALKFKVAVTGLDGSAKLLEVIDFTTSLPADDTILGPGETSDPITITGKMDTAANNDYQNLTASGIAITVVATQATAEWDSTTDQYDKDAKYPVPVKDAAGYIEAVQSVEDGGIILLEEGFTVTGMTDGDMTDTGKTITVDFNGQTAYGGNDNIAFRVRGNSTGNLSGGTIVANAGTFSAVSAAGNANGPAVANVSNMTLSNSTARGNVIKAFANGTVNVKNTTVNAVIGGGAEAAGGVINITDCTFTQKETDGSANSMNVAASNGGTANVYSGSFTSENYSLYAFRSGGTINVYGGTFKSGKAVIKADSYTTEPAGIFNIYGGEFDGLIEISEGSSLNIVAGTFRNTGLSLTQFKAYVNADSTVTEAGGVFTVK